MAEFQHDLFVLELGEAVDYFHGEFRLGIGSPLLKQLPLVGSIPAPSGAARLNRAHPLPMINEPKNTNQAPPR